MILLIDNYDSFTLGTCINIFCELGASVEVRRNDEIGLADIAALAPQKSLFHPAPARRMSPVFR